jgi:hypothetical protein
MIRKSTGVNVAKRQLEQLTIRAAQDFDAFYELRQTQTAKGRGSILVISTDGKGVVMRPEDLREHTRKAAQKSTQKMRTRLSKGEKKNRAQGLPVAAGVIEGACRHLVKDRMDVTGARWSLTGAEPVLRLRALKSSHDFEQYWTFHEAREYQRNHENLYAGGKGPTTTFPKQNCKRKHLTVIK